MCTRWHFKESALGDFCAVCVCRVFPQHTLDFSHEMWDQYSLINTACNYFRNTCRGRAKMGKDMLSFRPTLHPSTINTQECCLKYNNHHNGSDSKESAYSVGDLGSIPGLGRSPGGEHGNPLQNSCLENPRGERSLVGYSPWDCKELDMTE